MIKTFTLSTAALGVVCLMPQTALAQHISYGNPNNNQLAGGLVGAVIGGALGSNLAASNAQEEGTAIGALAGAIVGSSLANNRQGYYYSGGTYGQPYYRNSYYSRPTYNYGYYHAPVIYRAPVQPVYYSAPRYYTPTYYSGYSRPSININFSSINGRSYYGGRNYGYNSRHYRRHH